jgi:hypothetical protein
MLIWVILARPLPDANRRFVPLYEYDSIIKILCVCMIMWYVTFAGVDAGRNYSDVQD